MRSNNKLIIVISIVLALVIAGAVFAYLFLATDVFKSNQELFMKYISQEIDTLERNLDFQMFEAYEGLENQNKYESNTNIKIIHSEGGEVSNPLNNLTAKLNIQKNDEEQYLYADAQILYENEEYVEAEIIKEQDIYGIRFSDAVKQFITVKKDENIEMVANDIGIDVELLETLINESEKIISKERIITLKDKYLNIIIQELMNGTFQKQKNAIITYNDVSTETNAYSVSLSSEQVENMLVQILNNIKNETKISDKDNIIEQIDEKIKKLQEELEVPTINITVYEQNQKTIRTIIDVAGHKVTIENIEQIDGAKTKIDYSNLSAEQEEKYEIEINKQNAENQENVEIMINVIIGEDNYTIFSSSQMQLLNDKIEVNIEVDHKQGITTTSAIIENEINLGKDFEKAQVLSSDNNILISSLEQQRRQDLIKVLKEIVPQKVNERIDMLKVKFRIMDEQGEGGQTEGENTISQVEINKFNSKFEFYTGDEVSAENVKMLLDVVKNNLANYEIINNEPQEDSTSTEEIKFNAKLIIEKDVQNQEAINKMLEKIDDNAKYKILIFYKEGNGLIDYITITEV